MKYIAIIAMQIMLNKAVKNKAKCDNSIVEKAYDNMIENYKNTIMYLKSNKK